MGPASLGASMLIDRERSLVDGLSFPVVVSDERGRIEHLNRPAERLLGWANAEARGSPLTILMPSRMRALHEAGMHRYLETHESRLLGRPVRVPARLKSGEEIDIDLTLRLFRRPDGSDLIVGILAPAQEGAPPPAGLIDLEKELQERAYRRV